MTLLRQHKNKVDYGSQYFYVDFKSQSTGLDISQKEYTNIIKTFFELAVQKMINEAYRFLFPGIGLFYLIRLKQKIRKTKDGGIKVGASINWPETKKLIAKTGDKTQKVYYLNDHTDRHIYKITWDKRRIDFVNKKFYTFAINKKHRQSLKDAIVSSDKPLNAYEQWYQ